MTNTRLMTRLFSATDEKDEELTAQVAKDIEDAKANGSVDTDELKYEDNGDGKVAITDKENGEVTIAEKAEDGNYDLYPAEMTQQIEGYIHPEGDGVTPGQQEGEPDEHVEEHIPQAEGVAEIPEEKEPAEVVAEEGPVEGEAEVCPECGKNPCECEAEEDEKEFSVSTDNAVIQKIFSDQAFCERLFSEVIESEDTAKVGDLKVEKVPEEENTVVVTSESTGDQAKVVMNDDDMEVTELESKNFTEEEQYDALHIVGVDTFNHQIVDASEYTEEDANDLVQRLAEIGVDALQVFDNPDDAREYAINLLMNLGAETTDDVEEPEQAEFSNHDIFCTKYYSNHTVLMDRLFSEACNDVDATQSEIEDAIEDGKEVNNDNEVIIPVDDNTAIVEDKENGEYTKVVLEGDEMHCFDITKEDAEELMEKEYSDLWCDETETRYFSESEPMTEYMVRLFSDVEGEKAIEDAIEEGKQVENDTEVITPVSDNTAVIEDKENGEFTKAVMTDDDIDVTPISEEEAHDLTSDEEEKEYSDLWCDEAETRFFSESEPMTEYMVRLFSEVGSEKEIENAIEEGKVVDNATETITPINDTTAIVEDKENGEYTKAVMDDEGIDVTPIEESEAKEMLPENEETKEEEPVEEEETKTYSTLDKFFADVHGQAEQPEIIPAIVDPTTGQLVPADQMQPEDEEVPEAQAQPQISVEAIEDKALAAVQSIQAAASEAQAAIMNAKAAPVENAQENLQEAQFSENDDTEEKTFSENDNTLVSWLGNNIR